MIDSKTIRFNLPPDEYFKEKEKFHDWVQLNDDLPGNSTFWIRWKGYGYEIKRIYIDDEDNDKTLEEIYDIGPDFSQAVQKYMKNLTNDLEQLNKKYNDSLRTN
jgi:hypothetical protein